MIYWLYEHRHWFGGDSGALVKVLNIFKYHTFRAGGACLTSFALSMIFGEQVIRKLISLKVGQPIRTQEEVQKLHELHGKKAGTPTMGGVLILATFVLAVLLWTDWSNGLIWIVLGTTLFLGMLGFWDDFEKVSRKNAKGVSARVKLVWQFSVAIIAGWLFAYAAPTGSFVTQEKHTTERVAQPSPGVSVAQPPAGVSVATETTTIQEQKKPFTYRSLQLPFMKEPLIDDMGFVAIAFFALIIVGASNAVNLTDGLDGLATGCSITTGIAYTIFAYLASNINYARFLFIPFCPEAQELTIVAMALVGSCLGFLWYNCQPARMFMGDTGSLALGGCIATLAIGCKQELILVLVGGVFVMEALSVIIQVFSFRTRRVRVFRMAPIHHHFELGGWKESQVVVRFWMMSLLLALLGLASLKLR